MMEKRTIITDPNIVAVLHRYGVGSPAKTPGWMMFFEKELDEVLIGMVGDPSLKGEKGADGSEIWSVEGKSRRVSWNEFKTLFAFAEEEKGCMRVYHTL